MFSCKTWSPDRFGHSGSSVADGGADWYGGTRLPVPGPDRGGESGNVSNLPNTLAFTRPKGKLDKVTQPRGGKPPPL
ncbi:hypothetical protein GCM10029976_070290 [Kribbella albertanoniae]